MSYYLTLNVTDSHLIFEIAIPLTEYLSGFACHFHIVKSNHICDPFFELLNCIVLLSELLLLLGIVLHIELKSGTAMVRECAWSYILVIIIICVDSLTTVDSLAFSILATSSVHSPVNLSLI